MLSDQVDSQCEKIGDLEKLLDDKKEVLKRTEDILQREMINRSALETKKLELMSDLAGLKLRQAAIEKENMELRKKLSKTMQLEASVASTNADRSGGNNTIASSSQQHKNFGTMPKNAKPLETHFHVNEPKVCKKKFTFFAHFGRENSNILRNVTSEAVMARKFKATSRLNQN